jgi:hypothetical protein
MEDCARCKGANKRSPGERVVFKVKTLELTLDRAKIRTSVHYMGVAANERSS